MAISPFHAPNELSRPYLPWSLLFNSISHEARHKPHPCRVAPIPTLPDLLGCCTTIGLRCHTCLLRSVILHGDQGAVVSGRWMVEKTELSPVTHLSWSRAEKLLPSRKSLIKKSRDPWRCLGISGSPSFRARSQMKPAADRKSGPWQSWNAEVAVRC